MRSVWEFVCLVELKNKNIALIGSRHSHFWCSLYQSNREQWKIALIVAWNVKPFDSMPKLLNKLSKQDWILISKIDIFSTIGFKLENHVHPIYPKDVSYKKKLTAVRQDDFIWKAHFKNRLDCCCYDEQERCCCTMAVSQHLTIRNQNELIRQDEKATNKFGR